MDAMKTELKRLSAQKIVLEGNIHNDPAIADLYNQTVTKENELSRKLLTAGAKLDYQNSMVSMDLELPEDPAVAELLQKAGIAPRTPAPAAGGQPTP